MESGNISALKKEISGVIVGQENLIDRLISGLLCRGHILIEGVPGLAKTLAVRTLASSMSLSFKRIQFTPDLLPADIIGTLIYDLKTAEFSPRLGPVFSQIILADEINRAPAKVQSALLEAMQERQVTIGETTYALPEPFMVLATQNPIEQEGTYPLPEAQVDRFMMKVRVGYPSKAEERLILEKSVLSGFPKIRSILNTETIASASTAVRSVFIDERIKDYALDIVFSTRDPEAYGLKDMKRLIEYGVSPRASIALLETARAAAFLKGRGFVIPEDIKDIAADVLRHRLIISYEAEAEELTSENIISEILSHIEVP